MRDPGPQGMPHPPHRARFRLTGYFSLACLVGVLALAAALALVYRQHVLEMVVRHEESANVNLARVLARAALPGHALPAGAQRPRDAAALRAHPATEHLRTQVLALTRDLGVAKVKVYDASGLAVYSTDERQIGEDKAGNQGFRDAMRGRVTSQLTHRDRFDAIEGVINDRDLVSTYVPTRSRADGSIDGVFEVYVDVTAELAQARQGLWQTMGVVLACLGALYALLLALIRRADRLLQTHEAERDSHEARIRHLAFHDPLTGLPNRAAFSTALAQAVDRAATTGEGGALLFIDLNRFKQVNDQLGHAVGDALLCALADRLRAGLGPQDRLFRMGGDEFTVWMADEPASGASATPPGDARPRRGEQAVQLAQRLIAQCSRPVNALEHLLSCSISVGIARLPDDGRNAEQLLLRADVAMYAAKAEGGGACRLFEASLLDHTIRQRPPAGAEGADGGGLAGDAVADEAGPLSPRSAPSPV